MPVEYVRVLVGSMNCPFSITHSAAPEAQEGWLDSTPALIPGPTTANSPNSHPFHRHLP